MTTLNEARSAVYTRFLDNFTGLPVERITFDNEEFESLEQGSLNWVRLVVRSTTRQQDTIGRPSNRRYRSAATVIVQVYTQVNTGVKSSDSLVEEIQSIFEGVSFDGLDFDEAATPTELGVDGRWYVATVEAPFDYDEIK